jgi:hypothetical protein
MPALEIKKASQQQAGLHPGPGFIATQGACPHRFARFRTGFTCLMACSMRLLVQGSSPFRLQDAVALPALAESLQRIT